MKLIECFGVIYHSHYLTITSCCIILKQFKKTEIFHSVVSYYVLYSYSQNASFAKKSQFEMVRLILLITARKLDNLWYW